MLSFLRCAIVAMSAVSTATLLPTPALANQPLTSTASKAATPKKLAPRSATSGQVGIASYYGNKFNGRRTASGEIYRHGALTAAHRTLGFGRQVRVTSLLNGRSVVVRINDRGPFIRGRVIDVSQSAARQLGITGRGVGRVRVQPL